MRKKNERLRTLSIKEWQFGERIELKGFFVYLFKQTKKTLKTLNLPHSPYFRFETGRTLSRYNVKNVSRELKQAQGLTKISCELLSK